MSNKRYVTYEPFTVTSAVMKQAHENPEKWPMRNVSPE